MSPLPFRDAFERSFAWASRRRFEGWDPYDALLSPLLARLDRRSRWAGIAATQAFRRSPVNLRPLFRIPRRANAKGLALFLESARVAGREAESGAIAARLRSLRAAGYDEPCWGYPFPWRARAFFLPEGTPTVVATAFCALALGEARASVPFLARLHRHEERGGACLSYSPLDRSRVVNASLLGARLLVAAGRVQEAEPLVRHALARQREDGAWAYGDAGHHGFVDNFHTGFVLDALDAFERAAGDAATRDALERGARFWAERFFDEEGRPAYFADRAYPIDVHAGAQAVLTFVRLRDRFPEFAERAARTGRFLVDRMLDGDGAFAYQLRRTHTVRIPYMRWSQAWGVRALAELVAGGIDG